MARPSRIFVRRRLVASTAITLALVATACGSDEPSGSAPSGDSGATSVTIYSGRTEDLIQPILDEFDEATGITVEVKYGDSADLALLIEEEAAAGNARRPMSSCRRAPVRSASSSRTTVWLDSRSRTLDLVPATVRDDGGKWVGFSGRQRVLVYNTDLLDAAELPTSVFDMTDPAWKGKIGVAPSNGSFQDFVTAMRVTEGDDVTARVAARRSTPTTRCSMPKNTAIVAAVGRGEVEVGLVNHYYNYRALAENPGRPVGQPPVRARRPRFDADRHRGSDRRGHRRRRRRPPG